jgi:hypothetical protein
VTIPDGLLHAVRTIGAGRRPVGRARRWKHLLRRGLVSGTPDAPTLTDVGRALAQVLERHGHRPDSRPRG